MFEGQTDILAIVTRVSYLSAYLGSNITMKLGKYAPLYLVYTCNIVLQT